MRPSVSMLERPWRARERMVYAMLGEAASDEDRLLGTMDYAVWAEHVAELHNAWLATREAE